MESKNLNLNNEESFSIRFIVAKQGKHDSKPSYLVRLPNHFTDDSIDAKKFLSERDAKNAMLKITTYSLDPQKYSVKKYHFHNSLLA